MFKKRLLFLFDFDHTVVDDNTDTYIWKLLPKGKESLPEYFANEQHWNKFMRKLLQHYYHIGITPNDLKQCLQEMELTNGFRDLFNFIKNNRDQIECAIISDSNTYFIDAILQKQQLHDLFDQIYTNPVHIIENIEISLFPYHKNECESTCPRNMCKRTIIQQNYKLSDYDRVCYFGDGKNDYCPGTILRKEDIIFVRKGYALEKQINKKSLQCEVSIFESGLDCINRLKNIII